MNFEIIDTKTHYEGRAFNVERVNTRLPDGRSNHYDLVQHNDSVTILPMDEDGNIYFVSQYRMGAMDMLMELPAGVMEKDELPEDCAAREIREEIGFAASNLKKIGEFYLAPGYSTEFMHIYLATGLYANPLEADADEFLNVKTIPVHQVYEMAFNGEFKDAKTLGALLLAKNMIKNR